jgi:broad specificity phosphatase PhoE
VDRGLRSSKDYQKVIDAVFNFWVSPASQDERIQSWSEYSQGVRQALLEVIREQGAGKTVGIFTSGGTIATIVAQVLGLTGEQTYQFYEPIFNCSVTQLFYSGERVSLSYFNDRSFLQLLGTQGGENLVSYR